MQRFMRAVLAILSSLWVLAFHSAGLKCLLVARRQFGDSQFSDQHFAGMLDEARRDFNIGCVWLLVVVLFWTYRLARPTSGQTLN